MRRRASGSAAIAGAALSQPHNASGTAAARLALGQERFVGGLIHQAIKLGLVA
jgi:hypothetical protein